MLLACCAPGLGHAAAALPDGWDPARFISTDEIRPGMQGVGYTVFQGTTIETFEVEILGVLHNRSPQSDAIIARMAGGIIDKAGVIQGMSGSPVYLDGRLAGAVAFGWSFMSEPIGGITPIQYMLPILGRPGVEPQRVTVAAGAKPQALDLTAAQVAALPEFPAQGPVRLEPLATPVSVSGLAPEFVERVRSWFEPLGLMPVAGGGSAAPYAEHNPPLEPGAALSVPLVEGDLSATAIGTVTHVEGGNVVGFGHGFRYAGATSLPLGNAYILGVLPNQRVSSKLGVALHTLGGLQQDRLVGIAGALGAAPPMVPIRVSVQGPGAEGATGYAFRVAPDRDLLPALLAMVGAGAVFNSVEAGAPYSAKIALTIRPQGRDPITTRMYHSDRGDVSRPVGFTVLQYAGALLDNPYGRLALDGADLQVTVRGGLGLAYLEEVRPRHLRVRPGESLPVTVVYRLHEGGRHRRQVDLTIPATTPEGRHTLVVSDARRTRLLERRRAPMRFRPTSLDQYLELLALDFPENELTLTLLSSRPGMAVHGQELAQLPGSVLNVMRTAATRDLARPTRGTVVAQATLPLDAVVNGAAVVAIDVDRHAP